MSLNIINSDATVIKQIIVDKETKLRDLGLALGDAAKKSGSFVSNNPEYAAVHLQMQNLQQSVDYYKGVLDKYSVDDESQLNTNEVGLYSLVRLSGENGTEQSYYIILPEINKYQGEDIVAATPESPIGRALLGHKVGDKIKITLPGGEFSYEIINLEVKY